MTAGIYGIENKNNGKIYIGSSKNIEKRFLQHIRMLNKNIHHSIKLQNAWNRTNDKSVFQFMILEEVNNIFKLKIIEQEYIDNENSFNDGYNSSALVDNPQYTKKKITLRNK